MASESFEIGDLVWAKMKGFAPPWPAQIREPPANSNTPSKMKYYVHFFGSKNYAWIPKSDIFPHSEQMVQTANLKRKTMQMQSAIDEILLLSEKQGMKTKAQYAEIEANTSNKLSQSEKRAADIEVAPMEKKQKKVTQSSVKHVDEVELDSSSEESIGSEERIEDHEDELDSSSEESIGSEEEIEDHEDELDSSSEESIGSEEEIEDHEDELDSSSEESIGSEDEIDQSSETESSSEPEIPRHPKPSCGNSSRTEIGSDFSDSEEHEDLYAEFLRKFRRREHNRDNRLTHYYRNNPSPIRRNSDFCVMIYITEAGIIYSLP